MIDLKCLHFFIQLKLEFLNISDKNPSISDKALIFSELPTVLLCPQFTMK